MIDSNHKLVQRTTRLAGVLLGIYVGVFVWIAVRHILYPGFTLPIEGDILQHIERLANVAPPYPRPGADFIALGYMPLYYMAATPFYLLFGDSFAGPRLLSSLCALAAGGLVILIARKESASSLVGGIAGILYFASYGIMDACLASATTDSMMTLLVLAGYWFWAYGSSRFADLTWILLFALAFWTRQHGAFFFGFAVVYALLFRKNSFPRWVYFAALLLCGPVLYLILGRLLGEGFFLHTWMVPARWEHSIWISLKRTVFVMACEVPLALLLSVFLVREEFRREPRRISPLLWFLGGTFLSVLATMQAAGSSNNHYIPLIAVLCITAALGARVLWERAPLVELRIALAVAVVVSALITVVAIRQFGDSHPIPRVAPFAVALALACTWIPWSTATRRLAMVALPVAGQLASAAFNPTMYLPVQGYRSGIEKLQREITALDGPAIWADFGNAPAALTGTKLLRSPSWVAREDIRRQIGAASEAERDLMPFHQRIRSANGLYVLSNDRIDGDPAWKSDSGHLRLVKDYGPEFRTVQAISHPWYGGGEYPRFLYRLAAPSGQQDTASTVSQLPTPGSR